MTSCRHTTLRMFSAKICW